MSSSLRLLLSRLPSYSLSWVMNKNAELPFVIAAKQLGVVMEIPQSGHSNNGLVSSVWTDLIVRTLWVCSEWL